MRSVDLFEGTYRGKTVFVTGHSGFGGVWLSAWLVLLGANVVGYSNQSVSERSKVELPELTKGITEIKGDIRNRTMLEIAVKESEPDIIFHLAAQSLVIPSYFDPYGTFETNVGGTTNLLEIIRGSKFPRATVFVTSDKVYKNRESEKGYEESDELGGHDPYSASKAMSELAINSYLKSVSEPSFSVNDMNICSVRSGNWIGGGDFSDYRLVPDLAKALGINEEAVLRNPTFIRPWQFILDPLKGFLMIGMRLLLGERSFRGPWNFGPSNVELYTCEELAQRFIDAWGNGKYRVTNVREAYHETTTLALNSQKAVDKLYWRPTYNLLEAIQQTVDWYKLYFHRISLPDKKFDMTSTYFDQIRKFATQHRLKMYRQVRSIKKNA